MSSAPSGRRVAPSSKEWRSPPSTRFLVRPSLVARVEMLPSSPMMTKVEPSAVGATNTLAISHWGYSHDFDQTTDGRILKLLNVVDKHTREALTITVDRRIDADATVAVLDHLVAERGTGPRFLRCDNGPELTANALRDWCRFTGNQLHRARLALAEPLYRVVSAGGSATSCSPWRPSAACSRLACWSRTGASSTTPSGPTAPWLPDPDRLRQDLDHQRPRTLITRGPAIRVQSGKQAFPRNCQSVETVDQ